MSKTIFEGMTEAIITQLEQGVIPWKQPWTTNGPPRNFVSRRPYRGINVFLLASRGFASPYWITQQALLRLGGQVRDGEAPTEIFFWQWRLNRYPKHDEKSNSTSTLWVPSLQRHYVLNMDQCLGIQVPSIRRKSFNPLRKCERIIEGMPKKPRVEHGIPIAYYQPLFDFVNMPNPELFISKEEYYSALFHELVHATGHISRLNRHKPRKNGFRHEEHAYSQEELIAEFGAVFLCAQARIASCTIKNSETYIAHWLRRLNSDTRFLFYAAHKAQKAVDFIRNKPHIASKPESGTKRSEVM